MNFHELNMIARREFNNLRQGEQKRYYIAFTKDELYAPIENSHYTIIYDGPGYINNDEEMDEEIEQQFFIYFFINFCARKKTQKEINKEKAKRNEHYKTAIQINRARAVPVKRERPSSTGTLHDLGPAAAPFLQGIIQADAEDQAIPGHFETELTDAGMIIINSRTRARFKCPLYAYRTVREALTILS